MNNLHGEDVILMELETLMKLLVQLNAEAKDNDKFLNTLERQFNILQSHDLSTIEQCLPSLFNGLRLVFIISRHYKDNTRMTQLLSTIANQICDRVTATVNLRTLLKPSDDVLYETQLEESIKLIEEASSVLYTWIRLFKDTKDQLEKEGPDRWDYTTTIIKGRPQHMMKILSDFKQIAMLLKKFLVLLGPKLKAVTGNTNKIDELIDNVKGLVRNFEDVKYDFFHKDFEDRWNASNTKFHSESRDIQIKTTELIQNTFGVLRSSESGFEFLQRFKNLDTLEEISTQLKNRYNDVLDSYRKELDQNKALFIRGKDKDIVSKNRPPVAGTISWNKAIYHRIKAPIAKFLTRADVFDNDKLTLIKAEYLSFAKEVEAYWEDKFKSWNKKIEEEASEFLKNQILAKNASGEYYVNFRSEFKVLISEAKYLDRTMTNVSKRILNIALQETEYYRYVDKRQTKKR